MHASQHDGKILTHLATTLHGIARSAGFGNCDDAVQEVLCSMIAASKSRGGLHQYVSSITSLHAFLGDSLRHARAREQVKRLRADGGGSSPDEELTTHDEPVSTRSSEEVEQLLRERIERRLRESDHPLNAVALLIADGIARGLSVPEMAAWYGIPRRSMYRLFATGVARLSAVGNAEAALFSPNELPLYIRRSLVRSAISAD